MDEESPLLSLSVTQLEQKEADKDGTHKVAHPLPAEQNPWWATGIQIMNSMLGSGILTFPYTLAKDGWVTFVTYITLFGAVVFATSVMMIKAGKARNKLNFSELAEDVLGHQMSQLLKVAIILSNMGALMSYLNVIGALGDKIVSKWTDEDIWVSTYSGFMIMASILIMPLIFLRSYGELTYISLVSLAFIVCITFFVLGEGLNVTGTFDTANAWPSSNLASLETMGTFAYAASVQTVIFEAYLSTTKEDKPKFMTHSLVLSVGLGMTLLVLMGAFGYAAFGQECESNIMLNFDATSPAVQVAQFIVILHLVFYIPNSFVIMRLFAAELAGIDILEIDAFQFSGITVGLWAIPVVLMALVPRDDVAGVFSLIIDITGDIPISFSCFILPAAIYYKCFQEMEKTLLYFLSVLTFILGVFLLVVSSSVDCYLFARACSSGSCSNY